MNYAFFSVLYSQFWSIVFWNSLIIFKGFLFFLYDNVIVLYRSVVK